MPCLTLLTLWDPFQAQLLYVMCSLVAGLLKSSEDALLEVPFHLVKIVGLVEHGLDSEWYLDPDPLLGDFGFMGVLQ